MPSSLSDTWLLIDGACLTSVPGGTDAWGDHSLWALHQLRDDGHRWAVIGPSMVAGVDSDAHFERLTDIPSSNIPAEAIVGMVLTDAHAVAQHHERGESALLWAKERPKDLAEDVTCTQNWKEAVHWVRNQAQRRALEEALEELLAQRAVPPVPMQPR